MAHRNQLSFISYLYWKFLKQKQKKWHIPNKPIICVSDISIFKTVFFSLTN